jgi:hypothetical protein
MSSTNEFVPYAIEGHVWKKFSYKGADNRKRKISNSMLSVFEELDRAGLNYKTLARIMGTSSNYISVAICNGVESDQRAAMLHAIRTYDPDSLPEEPVEIKPDTGKEPVPVVVHDMDGEKWRSFLQWCATHEHGNWISIEVYQKVLQLQLGMQFD